MRVLPFVQTVICAWCKRFMVLGNSAEESHGICPECIRAELEGAEWR